MKINFKNLFQVLLRKIYKRKLDDSKIPEGLYCYTLEEGLTIKLCPYYKVISKFYNGCLYTGHLSDDIIFDDMCKICNKNYTIEFYDKDDNVVRTIKGD